MSFQIFLRFLLIEPRKELEELVLLKKNNFRIKDVFSEMRERQGGVSSISLTKGIYYMLKVGFAILMVALRKKEKEIS